MLFIEVSQLFLTLFEVLSNIPREPFDLLLPRPQSIFSHIHGIYREGLNCPILRYKPSMGTDFWKCIY